jgi:DNA-binding MarR family transcriptional regulator
MDVLKELGAMALGSRLRRLLERLNKDVSLYYRTLGLGFQPHWFSTLYLLGRRSPMTVTGIAEALGYTHPAVTKLAGQMVRAGLVASSRGRDRRERRLALTGKGRGMIETL